VTALSADDNVKDSALTQLDDSMKYLRPPPQEKTREEIKLKFLGESEKQLVVLWSYTRPGYVTLKSIPKQWATLEFDEVWKEILQLDQTRYPLYNIAEQEEVVLEIHFFTTQPTVIKRFTLPRGILQGALQLLSERVMAKSWINQHSVAKFTYWFNKWRFSMGHSGKANVPVIGMMKFSAWLQEMLGVTPQVRKPWLEINFKNYSMPCAFSGGREMRWGWKEMDVAHLKSTDGNSYHKVYTVIGKITDFGSTAAQIIFTDNQKTVYMDQDRLAFKHETTLDSRWKGSRYNRQLPSDLHQNTWLVGR